MDAELAAYKAAIEKVGAAVQEMNTARAALHAAVEQASETTGKNVAQDTAAKPVS